MRSPVPPRVFLPFFAGSMLLTLTWGATLGMINLARLAAGWGGNCAHTALQTASHHEQGTASSIPETWLHYESVAAARAGATRMYRDDRVLRVMLVADGASTFIEWIER